MPSLTVKIRTVSPLFLNGADKGQPELRAASVRGQLRYWFRAIEGAKTSDLQAVWKAEEAIFGSTECGSHISVRLLPDSETKTIKTSLLPHKEGSQQNAINADMSFRLELVSRPGSDLPTQVSDALLIWLMLGGLGKRSRRMMGALDSDVLGESKPKSPEKFANLIGLILKDIVDYKPTPQIPNFPTLHPDHSRIVVGKKGCASMQEADKIFFDLLHKKSEYQFGSASPRRASPLIA
jgi:CRISPR-associated protein Cmr1